MTIVIVLNFLASLLFGFILFFTGELLQRNIDVLSYFGIKKELDNKVDSDIERIIRVLGVFIQAFSVLYVITQVVKLLFLV